MLSRSQNRGEIFQTEATHLLGSSTAATQDVAKSGPPRLLYHCEGFQVLRHSRRNQTKRGFEAAPYLTMETASSQWNWRRELCLRTVRVWCNPVWQLRCRQSLKLSARFYNCWPKRHQAMEGFSWKLSYLLKPALLLNRKEYTFAHLSAYNSSATNSRKSISKLNCLLFGF